jgi:hypothetical protein
MLFEGTRWRKKLQAYEEIILRWREILRKRRIVQSLRTRKDRDILQWMGWNLDFFQVARSPVSRLAAIFFNPLFLLLRWMVLILVWW